MAAHRKGRRQRAGLHGFRAKGRLGAGVRASPTGCAYLTGCASAQQADALLAAQVVGASPRPLAAVRHGRTRISQHPRVPVAEACGPDASLKVPLLEAALRRRCRTGRNAGRPGTGRGLPGRLDLFQHRGAGLGLAARPRAREPGGAAARHRAQWRGGGQQRARVLPRPAGGWRYAGDRGAAAGRSAGATAGGQAGRDRGPRHGPPGRLPGRGLCPSLCRLRRARARARTGIERRPLAAFHPHRRPGAAEAHGLQGRIRGWRASHRRRFRRSLQHSSRARCSWSSTWRRP